MPNLPNKKTSPKELPLETWRELYAAADALFALEPWEIVPPDIFLEARHPQNGTAVHASVMGSMNTLFGLSLHDGAWAHYALMKAHLSDEENVLIQYIHRMNTRKIEFVKKSELSKRDKDRLKLLGYKPRDGAGGACFPYFEVMKDGCAPWPPDAVDAAFFLDLLPRFTAMIKAMASAAEALYDFSNAIAVWPEEKSASSCVSWHEITWKPFKNLPEPDVDIFELDEFTMTRLLNLPQSDLEMELDAFAGFATVGQGPRPWFMKLGIAIDGNSDMVLGIEIGKSGTDSLENIAGRALVNALSKINARPNTVVLCQSSVMRALGLIAGKLEIKLKLNESLPAVERARATMPEDLGV
jgi:hypothetical protein